MEQIYLYNTLHRQKETFNPIEPGKVRMYTCGPTVYDYAHIGNLRSYIFADTLKRMLQFNGYQVTHAMNITDVGHLVGDGDEGEDKLELGAKREGIDPLAIAKKYTDQFLTDLNSLNIEIPDKIKSATETIDTQIEIISILLEKGFAYKTASAVYFDTSKVPDYGKLTSQRREDMQTGARDEVVTDPDKRTPQDFALWFFLVGRYVSHILHWPSPWGEGFPGWHIECSAISRQLLGQPFDIHTGGVDHIGTHHTNEIAQSESAYDKPLANYWLHNEFLLVDGKKMAKSEGNQFTLRDLVGKGFSPLDFRYLCLMAHYRSKMNFTWEALNDAKNTRNNIQQFLAITPLNKADEVSSWSEVVSALNNDLDTPKVLAILHDSKSPALWQKLDSVIGLELFLTDIPEEVMILMRDRNLAREKSDWQKSDELRATIENSGYKVIDSVDGSYLWKD